MSVLPDALRSAVISSTVGDLTFAPSAGSVLYYEARVYAEGTSAPLLTTKYLGVPGADVASGLIKVNIGRMLNALAPGNYVVTVAAVGAGGTDESIQDVAYTVPLQS